MNEHWYAILKMTLNNRVWNIDYKVLKVMGTKSSYRYNCESCRYIVS